MKKYLLLLLVPILSYASIGKITVLKGDVKIQRDGGVIQAKNGTTLEKHDFIKTNVKGKVQIVFSDKTIFTIGKNSTLDIADYLYDESKPKQNKAKFNVLKGAFSSITGRIGKLNKSKFKLKTKSASIGIRGTVVKANQETVMCTEGAITVTTNNGISMDVEAGQKTDVSTGVPTPPEEIQAGEVESLGLEVKESEQEDGLVDLINKVKPDVIVEDDPIETRDIVLKGRTIATDGSQQYVTIEVDGLQNELTIDSSTGMTMTDDLGNAITSSSRDDVVWGHWVDDPNKKWVAGQSTSAETLDSLRDASNTVNATYSGKVMGSVNGNDNIKMDSTNDVTINTALGGGQNSVDGSINFETETNQAWNTTFEGRTSGNTFSSTSVSGDATSGSVDGAFYGTDATSVGGTFDLDNAGGDTATGVFKADKQ
ncbi:MAG: FecR domain-containing protein [Campylobacterota bacterium]|nr:FecR domain-containing protein [Campylobacterota bacterium]